MDILERLQLDVDGYIRSEASDLLAVMQHVPVIVTNQRDQDAQMSIQQTVDMALAGVLEKNGKVGLTVMVMDPEAGVPEERMAGPFIEIEQQLRVVENRLFNMGANGTKVPAGQLAINLLGALHGWQPGGMAIDLRGRGRKAIERVRTDDDNLLVWEVNLFTRYQIQPVAATMPPVIAFAGELPAVTATLTCPDVGAAIYYSLDGRYPDTLYTAPVEIDEPCTVRSLAILGATCLPSEIVERSIGLLDSFE